MNKKGFTIFAVLLGITYFLVGMITYQLIKPDITIQRDSSHLNCTSPDDWGDMGTCLILDGTLPILIISILAVSGAMVTEGLTK